MNPLNLQTSIREYDILISGGMPQVPDPVYGREPKTFRQGRNLRPRSTEPTDVSDDCEPLFKIELDLDTGKLTIVTSGDEED